MKVAVFALGLVPRVCGAAEPPLFPSAEGTTWNYDLLQEKPIESFDLTGPKEEEHLAVTYRLGGIETVENKEWRRIEIYRAHTLESVDLVAVEERGIICPARVDSQGTITRLIPPQLMLSTPLKTGAGWNFDGTIANTKVKQRYEITGEEEVDVPAGKFHAWRIHCEQTSPAPATIDRWFVPGNGFVKVETVVKAPSGGVLERSSLKLKGPPGITSAPQKYATPRPKKLSAGVSSKATGELKTEFKADTPAIYAQWHGHGLPDHAKIRAVFSGKNVPDVSADYQLDESSTVSPAPNAHRVITLSKPEGSCTLGNYRREYYDVDALAETAKFKISK